MRKLICCLLAALALCSIALAEEQTERKIDPKQPMVALSFDDGPSPYTQSVLDVLAENDCHATFFMVGTSMTAHPEMVPIVYESGNEIGLHTWKHTNLNDLSRDAVVRNLTKCTDYIHQLAPDAQIRWLRPPYGAVGPSAYGACTQLGMYIATWTVDSADWRTRNADKIYKQVISHLSNGAIILFHDTVPATAEALARLLPEIKAQGYQVLSVDELMSFYNGELRSGTHYYHLDPSKIRTE